MGSKNAEARSQPVWPRTRQRNWAPNRHDALHRLWGILECGRSEEGRRRIVRACLTNTRRLLDGTCEQFFSRFLFLAAINFQKREYAEHEDRHSHNAEQRPAARSLATHHKDARIGRAPKREEARCAFRRQMGREILQAPA